MAKTVSLYFAGAAGLVVDMKRINWNDISELGLLERINKEIMHPLGLAVYRAENGNSGGALVADDGLFEYSPDLILKNYPEEKVRRMIQEMVNAPKPTNQQTEDEQ